MNIFLDTDILLDVILERQPHSESASLLLSLCEENEYQGVTSSLILANIYYVIKKIKSHATAIKAISKLRSFLKVLPLTDKEIGESIHSEFKDFEDGIQYFIAKNNKIKTLVTRNKKDFKKANIVILSAEDLLRLSVH